MSEYRDSMYVGKSLQQYITSVFMTMGLGLAITALVAFAGYYSLVSGGIMYRMAMSGAFQLVMLVMVFVQLGLCIALSRKVTTMHASQARVLFVVYAAITGITFSFLPLSFGEATVFTAFAFSAVMYIAAAVIGHFTRVDLSKFQGLFIGGLVALVVVSLLGMFIPSLRNSLMISYAGVILFLAITAWDMQRIKAFYYQSQGNFELQNSLAIFGAFELYLDFINIFLYVLRILGSRSRN